jgi:hypothetical protein
LALGNSSGMRFPKCHMVYTKEGKLILKLLQHSSEERKTDNLDFDGIMTVKL